MITTGTKYFIGVSAAALTGVVLYAIASDAGALGVIGLLSVIVAAAFLAGITSFVRDGEISTKEATAVQTSPAAAPVPGASWWPLTGAVAVGLITVGLITEQAFVLIGVAVLLGVILEWLIQAWSERASSDPAHNEEVRSRLLAPLEIPIFGAVILGIVVFGFSRLMLTLSKDAGPVFLGIAGAVVLFFGYLFAKSKTISRGVVAGIISLGLVGMAAGGVAAALSGERRQLEEAAEEDHFGMDHRECGVEETTWDKKASQTVAAKSNIAATVTLTDEGLTASQVGIPGELDTITIPRSNPSSIIFYNETDEPRRLLLELEQVPIEGTNPPVTEQVIMCTALVKTGGSQFITFTIGQPSFAAPADAPFRMTVPGVEGVAVAIEVP